MFGNQQHKRRRFHPLKVLFFVLAAAAYVLVFGWVVMYLWNLILPEATGVKPLTYWQAIGLLVLCKVLFGGFGHRGRRWESKKARWRDKWQGKWRQKWKNLSEEERQEMKARWKRRCQDRDKL